MPRARLGVIVVVVVAAIACNGEPDGGAGTTIQSVTTSTGPIITTTTAEVTTTTTGVITTTTTAIPGTTAPTGNGADGSGCTPGPSTTLPDGNWFGLVTTSTPESVEFDLACWFSGDAAVVAAAEDGEESPPPNDYYVRNDNPTTRTVPIAASTIAVFYPTGDPTGETEGTFEDWRSVVEERGPFFGVWLEVVDGEVTTLREQWVP